MRLWAGWTGLAVLVLGLIVSNFCASSDQSISSRDLGLDFIAFYRAGDLVRSGHANQLYDLEQTRQYDQQLAQREQLELGDKYGAFLNPPFLAWLYEPLVRFGYRNDLVAWTALSIACFVAAALMLATIIPSRDWKDWALVPALIVTSLPFLQTLGHGQNSCLSLLIATATVIAWRRGRGFAAGMVGSLLLYKPQLAAVLLAGLIISLGARALIGAIISTASLLVLNVIGLPGTLLDYLRRIGPNVQYLMATRPYIWARHVTFRAFWKVLLEPPNPLTNSALALRLSLACTFVLGLFLSLFILRHRRTASRDRLICALITTAPLLMPYYLDYDLLLLAIPATLLAAEMVGREPAREISIRDQWLIRVWIALYVLLLINPGLTGTLHCNLAVPLLTVISAISIFRLRPEPLVLVGTPIMDDLDGHLRIAPVFQALAS